MVVVVVVVVIVVVVETENVHFGVRIGVHVVASSDAGRGDHGHAGVACVLGGVDGQFVDLHPHEGEGGPGTNGPWDSAYSDKGCGEGP